MSLFKHVKKKNLIETCFVFVGEDESDPEEDVHTSVKDSKDPRDSGCFESSEHLDSARDEAKTEIQETSENKSSQEAEKDKPESEEGNPTVEEDAVEGQMKELTIAENS